MKTRQQTRTSAPAEMDTVNEGTVGGSESVMSSEEDHASVRSFSPTPPPPRKKREQANSAKTTKQNHLARRTQGKLAGVLGLPLEIFTEITRYLFPIDIISLSRSTKFFRALLLQRSAAHIWRTALQNVSGLPPCPKDLCEPQYAALLFTKYCSSCGETAIRSMDPYLNVRLCNACREEQLEYVTEIKPQSLGRLIYQSSISIIKSGRNQANTCLRTEKKEIEGIWADICAGKAQSDKDTIRWIKEMANACKERQKYARTLAHHIENTIDSRSKELGYLKDQRRQEIKRRLEENGWEERDWQFPWRQAREWTNLVEAPKLLTDRVWQKLYPQLVPLLETNRRVHTTELKALQRSQRKRRLHNLLINIKNQSSLLSMDSNVVTGTNSQPHSASASPDDAATGNENTSSSIVHTSKFTLRAPFPSIIDALKFPIISDLLDEDIDADTLENKFEGSRMDIEQVILDWCLGIEERFVTILDPSTCESENSASKSAVPILEFQFTPPPDSNFPNKLRPYTQLLLRADSVFRMDNNDLCPPPLYYPDLFSVFQDKSPGYFSTRPPSRSPYNGRPKLGYPWHPSHVVPYPEGVVVAKALLHQLGRPNAAQFELQALGARFSCGPCGEKWQMTWNELVQHYAEAQIHALEADRAQTSTTYINSHSLKLAEKAKGKGKPLVILHSRDESEAILAGISKRQKLMQCNLCNEFDIQFYAPRDAMLKHVRAVHAIKTPQANHYSRTPDSQMHIKIHDPDTHTYDTGSDYSESPRDTEYYVVHFGTMGRWMDWTPLRLCDMGWGTDRIYETDTSWDSDEE
ncbi:unnamed protein product [Rhizoctonia solani]|nr:unnamed protein product [Rhizoctonia solani]